MTLYQKYRPAIFSDLVEQSFARRALPYAIQHNKLVSSYLFSGPRGTGKTSTARIFAKAIQCLNLCANGDPCGVCPHCVAHASGSFLDTIEIDAASNNSVEDIRHIIEHADFLPSLGRYKIYIIDEVHMLSSSAFNAFLKTLEEPPSHVKFLLATTEKDKLPQTIISRTQRFEFGKISRNAIIERLRFIAEQEGVEVAQEGLEIVARLSDGGLRDAISLFEQFSIMGVLDSDAIHQSFGTLKGPILNELTNAYLKRNRDAYQIIIAQHANNPKRLLEDWIEYCAKILKTNPPKGTMSEIISLSSALMQAYVRLKQTPFTQLPLDLLIQERCVGMDESIMPSSPLPPPPLPSPPPRVIPEVTPPMETFAPPESALISLPHETIPKGTSESSKPFQVIDYVRAVDAHMTTHPTIKTILKKVSFSYKDALLTITHTNKMECAKLQDPVHLSLLREVLQGYLSVPADIEIKLQSKTLIHESMVQDIF